jgi:hypothetical protein
LWSEGAVKETAKTLQLLSTLLEVMPMHAANATSKASENDKASSKTNATLSTSQIRKMLALSRLGLARICASAGLYADALAFGIQSFTGHVALFPDAIAQLLDVSAS